MYFPFFQNGLLYGPFSKKLSNNGKDILRKNNSDFVDLNVMYAYRILRQASVCNIQAACYIFALLETLIGIFFLSLPVWLK